MTLKMALCTKDDLSEAIKLQKREQYEEERKKRIFNAKQRLFGLDLDTLERQIREKKKQASEQLECDKRYEEQEQLQKRLITAKEKELEKEKRIMDSDLNFYRCRYQRKDQRREFDLNDPNYLKKSTPVRISDADITLGISSAQIFYGEDLNKSDRQVRQREQQRAWLDQQVMERKQAEEARRQADNVYMESVWCRDKHLEEMAKSDHRMRHQIIHKIRQFNINLAKQKQENRQRQKQETYEDDMAEIYNMLSSDMLTENPDVAQSRTNPNKKIAFMYRGMTPDELRDFRKGQVQQLTDTLQRKTEAQLMDKQWEQYAINMDRSLMHKQIDMDRKYKQQLDDLVRDNAKLAIEQEKQRKDSLEQLSNAVYDDFYDQFNKTSR
ncbi:RIB43A-like with coiled-coils protein 2 [Drosophila sulfurigaster albostrigata]|uniref:RIB43A-like with coiled-coils protein 2 n=1 Tax=Drosophila albomicans TaxID=7291 RepID=A0A6P8WPU8_DROAB|nr:RIB43A-like with coiled-coils protein 2 [Drosophila albomicans]XP_060658189.1 RIB43A-like with coiled-coils protein 2 [Drosophila nasuta]XP_062133200.1 RIB43A-like with coiled-coils protein 2 [Drosophila sulfurigaster albostrigata]